MNGYCLNRIYLLLLLLHLSCVQKVVRYELDLFRNDLNTVGSAKQSA